MTIIPRKYDEQIAYALNQADLWTGRETELGLSRESVTELKALAEQAQLKRQLAEAAQEASRTATAAQVNAINTMLKRLSANLKQIKATAADNANPHGIYNRAGIPAPQTPTELGAPEAPSDQKAVLTSAGTVDLTWKNPSKHGFEGNTYFIIERRITRLDHTVSGWSLIGTSADKKYTDFKVPHGVNEVTYRIFAARNNELSTPSFSASIHFGTPPGTREVMQAGKYAV